jgi:amidophosphoribosyltransferase
VRSVNPSITQFETSCFDGHYITGDITSAYLQKMEHDRDQPTVRHEEDEDNDDEGSDRYDHNNGSQLDLNLGRG